MIIIISHSDKTESMRFKEDSAMSSLNVKSIKLEDEFANFGSNT